MTILRDLDYVKGLQANLRSALGGEQGKEVVKFLEQLCGWYDFNATDTNTILLAHGKRQVLATIKTLLELKPEEIVAIAQQKEL